MFIEDLRLTKPNSRKYLTFAGVTMFGWYLLACVPIFLSLIFIPYFDLFYLFPTFHEGLYIMPKLEKFIGAYSVEEMKKYNIVVWQAITIWSLALIINFIVIRVIAKFTRIKYEVFNWKRYLKRFFFTLSLPVGFALIFFFYDIKIKYSGLNNFDYVGNMMVAEYVYRQCTLFFAYQALFSLFFLLMTVDDF